MWLKLVVTGCMCLLGGVSAFSTTFLERSIRDLAEMYTRGDIELDDMVSVVDSLSSEEGEELTSEIIPLVESLRDESPASMPALHTKSDRFKRDADLLVEKGSFKYKFLHVESIAAKEPYFKEDLQTLESNEFYLPPNSLLQGVSKAMEEPILGSTVFMVGNRLHRVGKQAIEFQDQLDFVTHFVKRDYRNKNDVLIDVELMPHTSDSIFITMVVLRGDKGTSVFNNVRRFGVVAKLEDNDGNIVFNQTQKKYIKFQDIKLIEPIVANASLSSTDCLAVGSEGLLVAAGHRVVGVRNADAFTLSYIFEDSTFGLKSVPATISLADSFLIRAGFNDVKIVKTNTKRTLMVVARDQSTLVFEIMRRSLNNFKVQQIQTLDLKMMTHINLFTDDIGTILNLYSTSNKISVYMWDEGSFISTQTLEVPTNSTEPLRVRTVHTQEAGDRSRQEFLSATNEDGEAFFYYDVMPGIYQRVSNPLLDVKNAFQTYQNLDAKIIDLNRKNQRYDKPGREIFSYFYLFGYTAPNENERYFGYAEIGLSTRTLEIGSADDVTVCYAQLENEIINDNYLLDQVAKRLDNAVSLSENLSRTGPTVASSVSANSSSEIRQISLLIGTDNCLKMDEFVPGNDNAIDYLEAKVNPDHSAYVLKDLYLPSAGCYNTDQFKINAPRISMSGANVTTLSLEMLCDVATLDLVSNTLRTNTNQTINADVNFQNTLTVEGTTEILTNASTSQVSISPDNLMDLSSSVNFSKKFHFKEVAVTNGSVEVGLLNELSIADIITSQEMENSAKHNGGYIAVRGEKKFPNIATKNFRSDAINDVNFTEWKNSLLFKDGVQELSLNMFTFTTIQSDQATLSRVGGLDISAESLENFVRKDQNATVKGEVVFEKQVTVSDLVTDNLQGHNPAHYWINGEEQNITVTMDTATLNVKALKSPNLQGIDFSSDIAYTDSTNNFTAKNTFNEPSVVVDQIQMLDNVTLAGMDPSSVGPLKQVYKGKVTLNGTLVLKDTNVPVTNVNLGSLSTSTFTEEGILDEFLTRDTQQVLPLVTSIERSLFEIKTIETKTTLDGLDINADLVYTTGDQTINANSISFTGQTEFEDKLSIGDLTSKGFNIRTDAKIDGVDFKLLNQQTYKPSSHPVSNNNESVVDYCGSSPDRTAITGALILESSEPIKIISRYDVKLDDFTIIAGGANKSLQQFDNTAVQLAKSANIQFTEKIKFKTVEAPSATASKHIKKVNETSPTLNSRDLDTFNSQIVKKVGNYTVKTPVTCAKYIGNARISASGTVDSKDLSSDLSKYILLDDDVDIKNGLKVSQAIEYKSILHVAKGSPSKTYFCGKDLLEYLDDDFISFDKSSNWETVKGKKRLVGTLKVRGNITCNSANNANHPMGVNITRLESEALSISKDQTLTGDVSMDSITAGQLETFQVNNVELANICFRDEYCDISSSGSVASTMHINASVVFEQNIVTDQINSKNVASRIASLHNSSSMFINDLTIVGDLDWDNDLSADEPRLSDLFANLLVKSNYDWNTKGAYDKGQIIAGKLNLDGKVSMARLDINSRKINEGTELEFDIIAILSDSAKLTTKNTFSGVNIFNASVDVAKSCRVNQLQNTDYVNDVQISNYFARILDKYKTGEQEVVESWRFSNGLEVQNLTVKGNLDGIKVDNLVRKDVVDLDRPIPALTFSHVSVSGNLTGESTFKTNQDNFWAGVELLDAPSTMNQNITFNKGANFENLQVTTLNEIPTATFVTIGTNADQTVNGAVEFEKATVIVEGDLTAGTVNGGKSIGAQNNDTLRLDRDETINSASKVVFKQNVNLTIEDIYIPGESGLDSLSSDFINHLDDFAGRLLQYYDHNILKPLGSISEEVFVSSRVGFKKIDYLEEIMIPIELSNILTKEAPLEDIVKIDSIRHENGYLLNVVTSSDNNTICSLPTNCTCKSSLVLNADGFTSYTETKSVRTKTIARLPSTTYTLSSTFHGYSDTCPQPSSIPGAIEIEAATREKASEGIDETGLSALLLGEVMTTASLPVRSKVRETKIFELDTFTILIVSLDEEGHTPGSDYVLVFMLTGDEWVSMDLSDAVFDTFKALAKKPQKFIAVHTFKMQETGSGTAGDYAHIFFVEDKGGLATDEVNLVEMYVLSGSSATKPSSGGIVKTIPAPGISSLDIMEVKMTETARTEIFVSMAVHLQRSLITRSYIQMLQYVGKANNAYYAYALNTEALTLVGDSPILKISSRKMSDYMNVVVATKDEVRIYDYIPNEGVKPNRKYEVAGRLIDLAIFEENLPRRICKSKSSSLIFIITELNGLRSSKLFRVRNEGKTELAEIAFHKPTLSTYY